MKILRVSKRDGSFYESGPLDDAAAEALHAQVFAAMTGPADRFYAQGGVPNYVYIPAGPFGQAASIAAGDIAGVQLIEA